MKNFSERVKKCFSNDDVSKYFMHDRIKTLSNPGDYPDVSNKSVYNELKNNGFIFTYKGTRLYLYEDRKSSEIPGDHDVHDRVPLTCWAEVTKKGNVLFVLNEHIPYGTWYNPITLDAKDISKLSEFIQKFKNNEIPVNKDSRMNPNKYVIKKSGKSANIPHGY